MYRVLGCIYNHHDLALLVVAIGMCTFACGTARAMVLRARAGQRRAALLWLLGGGSVAGVGVWATHFVAMLAYQPGLPMRFDLALTAASALIAIIILSIAGAIALTRFGGTVSGIVFGIGVLAMHYVGMAAMEMSATYVWDVRLIASSFVVAISVGGIAGHVSMLKVNWLTNITSTALRIATILLAHFTAMAALTVIPTYTEIAPGSVSISPTTLSLLVIAAAAFIVAQALIVAMIDRHLKGKAQRDAAKMRTYIAELEQIRVNLEIATAASEAANKSKSAFLASMSHELRTPLNAILGFSEMILSETMGPIGTPKYKEYLEHVHDSGKHLLELINDVLDIARFDAGNAELAETVFDPAAKIRDIVGMMSGQAFKSRVTLTCDLPSALPFLNGDRRRIRQILLNLISNALKFTPSDGTVTVKAWVEDDFIIQVSDTGIGIAPQDFSKALEPFGQIDSSLARKYEGTGLGLPLTRQMVELHGGTLLLESRLGVGTTVTVRLPTWRILSFENEEAA